ncbi:MAG TPA: aspartate/glutamate racemase family protein [Rubrobacteraceae bacterium]|nr:aspartate/glutamate racemase family protein [Rubrobacteraceae bacterium]
MEASGQARVWYQSFVDPDEQRPYIDRLRDHLDSVAEAGFSYDVAGISPPDRYFHPITEFRIAGQVIRNALEAERQGFDAFIVGHFQEPGLNECKGAVDIPVVGLGEAAMLHALTLGRKIGLITINPIFIPWHEDQITRYGLGQRIVGVRAVNTGVDDYMRAFEDVDAYKGVLEQFRRQAEPLLEMGVEVIIPAGGLPMLLFSGESNFTVGGATVLNGITVAAKAAEMAVKLRRLDGTSVSRRSWFAKASSEAIREFEREQ